MNPPTDSARPSADTGDARLRLLADLHDDPAFEDERIDIVLYSTRLDPQPRPIHRAALEQGVEIGAGS